MPHKDDPVNWQPISEIPLIASMIEGALKDTRQHIKILTEARTRPHVLEDATIDRTEQVHAEQLEFVDIYAQQISRWRIERLSADQTRELDRMEAQNGHLRAVTADVLALASELRKGTIERVLAMSDVELGLHALLTNRQPGRR
jgi:nitrogen-specific signal transduction histidine kinase